MESWPDSWAKSRDNQNTQKQNKMKVLEAAISKTRKHKAAFQLSFPDHNFELG